MILADEHKILLWISLQQTWRKNNKKVNPLHTMSTFYELRKPK